MDSHRQSRNGAGNLAEPDEIVNRPEDVVMCNEKK